MTKVQSTMTPEQEAKWVRLMRSHPEEEGSLPPATGVLDHEHGYATGGWCADERCLAYDRGYHAGRKSRRG